MRGEASESESWEWREAGNRLELGVADGHCRERGGDEKGEVGGVDDEGIWTQDGDVNRLLDNGIC